ncbi:VanZ family protein [Oceanobacillus arenosus]|uniref:VanZ family protein n=1 Tax=Oceanobacillus arenosus TaxID=1229153 RepID=A0A3D8PKD8_9BACI|nr:VanZ family protein [Oceanobacillus arenosus]RDW16132.1 VanZ family protein [Oceanobacillus arenosus]
MKAVYVENKMFKKISNIAFAVYIFILFVVSFLGTRVFSLRFQADYNASYNIIPFKTILTYLLNFNKYNFDTWFFNTLGNLILFLPLGVLLPLTFRTIRLPKVIFISIILSLTIEVIQFLTKIGAFDIDKIILNTLGCILGFYAFNLIYKLTQKTGDNDSVSK